MRKLKLAVFLTLSGVWAFLCHHYYSVLSVYARLKYYLTNPTLYVGVELMYLWCVTILTYLAIKVVENEDKK